MSVGASQRHNMSPYGKKIIYGGVGALLTLLFIKFGTTFKEVCINIYLFTTAARGACIEEWPSAIRRIVCITGACIVERSLVSLRLVL